MIIQKLKKIKIDILIIIISIIIVVGIFGFPQFYTQFNLFALVSTLGVLIWYTYDTHRIANQTVEGNLRPLILRSGFIESWESIKFSIESGVLGGRLLEFAILKNIAKDISGYIIIDGKKFQLIFANNISRKNPENELSDLESSILIYLYDHFKMGRKNIPQKISTVYSNIGTKSGEYAETVSSSRFIKTEGDAFLLTDDGIRLMDSDKPIEYRFEPKWGWTNSGTILNAMFKSEYFDETKEDNQIFLTYSDMEGNNYFTQENKNFSQNSGKL